MNPARAARRLGIAESLAVSLAGEREIARLLGLPRSLSVEAWARTIRHHAGQCAYCTTAPAAWLDLYVPFHQGGGVTRGNALPACERCAGRRAGLRDPASHLHPERRHDLEAYLASRSDGENVGFPALALRLTRDADGAPDEPVTCVVTAADPFAAFGETCGPLRLPVELSRDTGRCVGSDPLLDGYAAPDWALPVLDVAWPRRVLA